MTEYILLLLIFVVSGIYYFFIYKKTNEGFLFWVDPCDVMDWDRKYDHNDEARWLYHEKCMKCPKCTPLKEKFGSIRMKEYYPSGVGPVLPVPECDTCSNGYLLFDADNSPQNRALLYT